jgi:CRP/FNR family transcriptional regulator, cyclic AMP receptor protein
VTNSEAAKIVRTILCRGLTNQQTEQIVNAMVPTTVPAGNAVFREDERAQGLFVLLEGTVEVVKEDGGPGGAVLIATVEAPSVLGEMSLITDRPHSATVRARTTCEFRLLTRAQFDRLLQAESLAAYKVVATLADVIAWRLNRMDEKFVELSRRGEYPQPVEELATFKQKLFNEWNY